MDDAVRDWVILENLISRRNLGRTDAEFPESAPAAGERWYIVSD